MSCSFLHHLPDVQDLFRAVSAALPEGGMYFAITEPMDRPAFSRLRQRVSDASLIFRGTPHARHARAVAKTLSAEYGRTVTPGQARRLTEFKEESQVPAPLPATGLEIVTRLGYSEGKEILVLRKKKAVRGGRNGQR